MHLSDAGNGTDQRISAPRSRQESAVVTPIERLHQPPPISKPLCVKGVFLGAVVCLGTCAELVTRKLGDGSGVTEPKSRCSGCEAGHAGDRDVPECPPGPNSFGSVVGR